jgi:hypothetical protein
VAHLLSRTKSPQEVTAVTFNYKKSPNFEFLYTKNKEKGTGADAEAPKAMERVFKVGFSEANQSEFLQMVVRYIVRFCPTWHQDRCNGILELGPVVARHVQAMISHSDLHLETLSDEMINEHDRQLMSMSRTLKKKTLELIAILVLRIIE